MPNHRLFPTPEDLQRAVDGYFEETPRDEYTVTGLALALGTNRVTLCSYGERDDYKHIIERAKARVENSYELSLRKRGNAGDIFALKNFGWRDERSQNVTAKVAVSAIEVSDAELEAIAAGSG